MFNEHLLKILHLEYVYLQNNEIATLPETGWNDSNIRVLDMESNSLYSLPTSLLRDSKVHNLNLKDNHIKKKELMALEGFD